MCDMETLVTNKRHIYTCKHIEQDIPFGVTIYAAEKFLQCMFLCFFIRFYVCCCIHFPQ